MNFPKQLLEAPLARFLRGSSQGSSGPEHGEVTMGSERSFGLVFATVFTTIALWPLVGGGTIRLWALLLAAAFVVVGWAWPAVLRPLNVAWFRFGLLIGAVTTPIVMALLYVTTFLPTGLVLRLTGRDVLGLQREPSRSSYWAVRDDGSPERGTMKRQF
jgi:hypothetical protein